MGFFSRKKKDCDSTRVNLHANQNALNCEDPEVYVVCKGEKPKKEEEPKKEKVKKEKQPKEKKERNWCKRRNKCEPEEPKEKKVKEPKPKKEKVKKEKKPKEKKSGNGLCSRAKGTKNCCKCCRCTYPGEFNITNDEKKSDNKSDQNAEKAGDKK